MRGHVTPVALVLVIVATPVAAQVTWDGDCGNAFWHSQCRRFATNWSPDGLPTAGDQVVLGRDDPAVTIFGATGNAASIACAGDLVITNGGQLLLQGLGGSIANLTLTNSSVKCATPGTMLFLVGASASNGGALHGPGEMQNLGNLSGLSLTLKSPGGGARFINGSGGSASLSAIPVELDAQLVNASGAMLTLVADQQVSGGSVSGTGLFKNDGTFITQHNGQTFSSFTISCDYLQSGGSFIVKGQSTVAGTIVAGDADFNAGTIAVSDDANLRFGQFGIYDFNGLGSISGEGNVFLQLSASPGPEWRVNSSLTVNMSGTDGFVLESGRLVLNDTLTNMGTTVWSGMSIRGGSRGAGHFVNQSSAFVIDTGAASNAVTLDAAFDNTGVVAHVQGHLFLDDEAKVTNQGQYILQSGGIERLLPALESEFINNGIVRKPVLVDSAGSSDAVISAVFRNNQGATLHAQDGTLNVTFGALHMNGGAIAVDELATIQLAGGISIVEALSDNLITGDGRFAILGPQPRLRTEGGTVRFSVEGPAPNGVHLFGGIGGAQGDFTNVRDLYWSGGTVGIDDGKGTISGFLENKGDVFLSAGTIAGDFAAFANAEEPRPDDSSIGGEYGLVLQSGPLNIAAAGGHADNAGVWTVSAAGTMLLGAGTFYNKLPGVMSVMAPSGQTTVFQAKYKNESLTAVQSGTLFLAQPLNLVNGTLEGGTWLVQIGATLDFPGPISVVGRTTNLLVYGNVPDLQGLTLNQGNIVIRAGELFFAFLNECAMTFEPEPRDPVEAQQPTGNSTLGYMSENFVPSIAGGDEVPIALITPALNNDGTVAPGGTGAAGPFAVQGQFNQSATGILRIELGGAEPVSGHDQLFVIGDVALGGTLRIDLLAGYEPIGGEEFTIVAVEGGSIGGAFDEISGLGQFSVRYAATEVVLTLEVPPVPGDVSNDGAVNALDLALLLGSWGECGRLEFCDADLDGDADVDAVDLGILLGAWD